MDSAVLPQAPLAPLAPPEPSIPEGGQAVREQNEHCVFFYREGLAGQAECVSARVAADMAVEAARLIPAAALEEARTWLEKNGSTPAAQPCVLVILVNAPPPSIPPSLRLSVSPSSPPPLSAPSPIVQRALALLDEHYAQGLSASTLARQLKVTTSYLCRLFKAETGSTISGHLAGRRVREAARLLQTDLTLSVKEIAFATGFGSLPQFNRIFRKYTSLSPRAYRRKNAECGFRNAE